MYDSFMKTPTLFIPCVHRSLERSAFVSLLIGCFAISPAQAVSPPPDGGYPGGNTAEGQNALFSLTAGTYNTAVGLYSLLSLSGGSFCTGVGAGTLLANTADQNTATGAGALLSNTTGLLNTAMERLLSLAIPLAPRTRPVVRLRWLKTPPVKTTRPMVLRLSITTQSVISTRPWELRPVLRSTAAATSVLERGSPARLVSMTAPIFAM